MRQRVIDAYHLAGHAVANCVTGRPFEYLYIASPDETAGPRGDIPGAYLQPDADGIDRAVFQVEFGGPIAERMYTGRWDLHGAAGDFETVCVLLDLLADRQLHLQHIEEAATAAMELVTGHWCDVDALAKALLEKESMTYEEVRRLVRKQCRSFPIPHPLTRRGLFALKRHVVVNFRTYAAAAWRGAKRDPKYWQLLTAVRNLLVDRGHRVKPEKRPASRR